MQVRVCVSVIQSHQDDGGVNGMWLMPLLPLLLCLPSRPTVIHPATRPTDTPLGILQLRANHRRRIKPVPLCVPQRKKCHAISDRCRRRHGRETNLCILSTISINPALTPAPFVTRPYTSTHYKCFNYFKQLINRCSYIHSDFPQTTAVTSNTHYICDQYNIYNNRGEK